MRKYVMWKDVNEWSKLRKEGYSYKKISERTGWNRNTIIEYIQDLELDPETFLAIYLASAFHDKCSLKTSVKKEPERIKELLRLEKERRGVSKDKLVFIGIANLASYYWCAMKSLLDNKRNELDYFAAYLYDRLYYSSELGLVDKMPTDPNELLDIGNELTYAEIEKILKKSIVIPSIDILPALREVFGELFEDARTVDTEESSKVRGSYLHLSRAENYPSIRWNFSWRDYVVLGIPDGITDNFVYEYKTTSNKFLMYYIKPVAFAQADLYGYFFKRPRKRVQIYNVSEGKTETWEEEVKKEEALKTLETFKRLDEGEAPIPPKKWKCKSCELKQVCGLNLARS